MTPSVGTVTQLVRNKSKVFGNSTRNKTLAGRDEKNMNLMNKFQTWSVIFYQVGERKVSGT